MKFYGCIRASASHKDWELMPAELMSSLGKQQFQIYDLVDSAAEWLYLWLQTWETLSPRSWLQHLGQNPTHPLIQGWTDSKMEHTPSTTPSAAARWERREQEGMTSIKHLPEGEHNYK